MKTRARIGIALGLLVVVAFLVVSRTSRDRAPGGAAPAQLRPGDGAVLAEGAVLGPVAVNVLALPRIDQDPRAAQRPVRIERELRPETPLSERETDALREAARSMPPQPGVHVVNEGRSPHAPTLGTSFDSLNFDDDPASVPPDPELAVGPNHIIAVVNSSFEIYNKTGTTLAGPTLFDTFFSGLTGCSSTFDPNALYDEEADRFFVAMDQFGSGVNGANNRYCMAVSQTSDPTGSWWLYSFDASANTGEFFDYPHAGVGDQAIFMGGNIFVGLTGNFVRSDVWAIDKVAMYAGGTLSTPVRKSFPAGTAFTPQPMHSHGFGQGTWPSGNVHYVVIDTVFDGSSMGVYRWTDPFGANTFTLLGTVNLNTATGVTGGFPDASPQAGSSAELQGNDWRPLGLQYRNGHLFMSQTVSCNPGGGLVNCVRWAEIDPAAGGGPAFVQGSVFASNSNFRAFPDIAANHCNDVAIGYSKFSTSIFPSTFVVGRLGTDTLNTLQSEVQLKAGEVAYSSFGNDPAPHRWGDYTSMTVDPDGKTFWYLGEYSRNNSQVSKWGTRIGSFTTSCTPPADEVTLTQPVSPNILQFCGPVSLTGTGITAGSVLKTFLSTSSGPLDLVADGIAPTSTTSTTWTGTLPCPWPAPNQYSLGQGFLGLQLVRTDTGFTSSNVVGIPLIGNTSQSVPSILAIAGQAISTTSWQPSIGLANVESVLANDNSTVYRIDGTGFASAVINVFTASGNCGPLTPTAQTATTIDFKIPVSCPTGPGSFQVVNATGNFRTSNAVSAPIGAAVNITSVQVNGNTITVNGAGFSSLTVINLFASNGSTVENFGGFNGGTAKIPLNIVNSGQFTFTRPGGAVAGNAFVEAINPPFIPFSGSGNDPQGAFTLP